MGPATIIGFCHVFSSATVGPKRPAIYTSSAARCRAAALSPSLGIEESLARLTRLAWRLEKSGDITRYVIIIVPNTISARKAGPAPQRATDAARRHRVNLSGRDITDEIAATKSCDEANRRVASVSSSVLAERGRVGWRGEPLRSAVELACPSSALCARAPRNACTSERRVADPIAGVSGVPGALKSRNLACPSPLIQIRSSVSIGSDPSRRLLSISREDP